MSTRTYVCGFSSKQIGSFYVLAWFSQSVSRIDKATHPPNFETGRRCVLYYRTNLQHMNILEDIEGEWGGNDDIFSEYDKEIGGTTLVDRVADSFAPAEWRFRFVCSIWKQSSGKLARTTNSIPSSNEQTSFGLSLKLYFRERWFFTLSGIIDL